MIHAQKFLLAATIAAFGLIVLSAESQAQGHEGHNHGPNGHKLQDVPVEELNKPGPLPEISIGKADAKITIIEYASMSCGHCGFFHRELLPKLKSKYIDTGVARLVVREFPLNYAAAAVSMLARCAGSEKTYEVISTMFDRQQQWLKRGDVRDDLRGIMSEFGMSEETFKRCLVNKELFHQIKTVRERAIDAFGVKSTPTFFINGKPLAGPRSIEEFEKIIELMLKQ